MALVTIFDLECDQADIISAFINGRIDKDDVYMSLPPGFDHDQEHMVAHLLKALYGLKQAPRIWQEEIGGYLISIGYKPLNSDLCVFQHQQHKGIILVYVDDLIFIHKKREIVNQMKHEIGQ
ncbi:Reverse transcriptase RNA-dependent DNA polymerase, partial [Macrophomina phaseolina MS6]